MSSASEWQLARQGALHTQQEQPFGVVDGLKVDGTVLRGYVMSTKVTDASYANNVENLGAARRTEKNHKSREHQAGEGSKGNQGPSRSLDCLQVRGRAEDRAEVRLST